MSKNQKQENGKSVSTTDAIDRAISALDDCKKAMDLLPQTKFVESFNSWFLVNARNDLASRDVRIENGIALASKNGVVSRLIEKKGAFKLKAELWEFVLEHPRTQEGGLEGQILETFKDELKEIEKVAKAEAEAKKVAAVAKAEAVEDKPLDPAAKAEIDATLEAAAQA